MRKTIVILLSLISALCFSYSFAETLSDNQKVKVEYTFPSQTVQIGKPFTVAYEIKGGSGKFEEIYYQIIEVTEHCGVSDGFRQEELSDVKGTFQVIPECGETIEINIGCRDQETGVWWSENYSNPVECLPNQDIPVSIDMKTSEIVLNEPFEFDYSIGGINELENAKVEIWAFIKDDVYPDRILEQPLEAKSGKIAHVLKAGSQLYIAIRGKDKSGEPFYVKTGRIAVDITDGYDDVSVAYTFPSQTVQIGKPFTVAYEIKGGSGKFEEIYYQIIEVTEHCGVSNGFRQEELSDVKGTFQVMPECGETIEINIGCRDQETGVWWSENYSNPVECLPNQDIPVSIDMKTSEIVLNEPFELEYSIGGNNEIENAKVEIWAFIKDDIYPDRILEQPLEAKSGKIAHVLKAGSQLYIAIYGKDKEGNPFYKKTSRINISDENIFDNCLILPASLRIIEAESFASVSATKVYIPESVEFIDKEAFVHSRINTIIGNTDLSETFARENGFKYIQYSLND